MFSGVKLSQGAMKECKTDREYLIFTFIEKLMIKNFG